MNRQTLVIGSIGLAGLASAVVINLMLPRAEPPRPVAKVETPAPRPVVKEAPKEAPPAPESPRPIARRAPPPKAEPEPSPPPAPIEVAHEAGVLRIDSDVPGARVFIDRQYVGTTPVTAEDVALGTHQLNVSAKGYDSIADTIDVSSGPRDIHLRFKEVHLDSAIEVVHKHRIGSCKGRLVATPQGLRYETSDRGDAFSAALLELETFQVDYLEKDLRVKPRKGKRYDFTDPEGNADRLFVFHRDVEKARERLKQGDPPAGQ